MLLQDPKVSQGSDLGLWGSCSNMIGECYLTGAIEGFFTILVHEATASESFVAPRSLMKEERRKTLPGKIFVNANVQAVNASC